MSNHLAIAAVTATLQRVLQTAIQNDVFGARVTTARPNTLEGGLMETGINIYLYLVTPNPAYSTVDQPNRRPIRDLTKRSVIASDLQYLLSVYGNDAELEPQRLMGGVIRTMQSVLTLTPEMIRETINDPTLGFLADADLADQMEPVRVLPTEVSVENLSKIWSVFFQTPYALSATYKATVVMIEGEEAAQRALPVRDRHPFVVPFRQLMIDRVLAQGGATQPIVADSTLVILGQQLYHEQARVRIASIEVEPQSVSTNQILVSLASVPGNNLRAGVQSIQVVHPYVQQATSASPHRGIESNLAAFVLRPSVVESQVTNVRNAGHDLINADVTVWLNLPVDADQRAVLILNEWSRSANETYIFKAPSRSDTRHEICFPVEKIKPGEYLVRVQVNGAESLLAYDTDPNSPTFNWYISPRVRIE